MANYATVTKEDSAATENKNDEEAEAIYHQQNPCLAKFNKVLGVVTVFVVLTSVVICAIQGSHQHNDFLLLANILLSSFIAVVHAWWYRRSHLAEGKVWFLILIYFIILIQCTTSDIYVFVRDAKPKT